MRLKIHLAQLTMVLIFSEVFAAGRGYLDLALEEFQMLMNPSRLGILIFGSDLESNTALLETMLSIDRR